MAAWAVLRTEYPGLILGEGIMDWRHTCAILRTMLLGGAVGLAVGFFMSSCVGIHGGFAAWLDSPEEYGPWLVIGLVIGGLASTALHLWRSAR